MITRRPMSTGGVMLQMISGGVAGRRPPSFPRSFRPSREPKSATFSVSKRGAPRARFSSFGSRCAMPLVHVRHRGEELAHRPRRVPLSDAAVAALTPPRASPRAEQFHDDDDVPVVGVVEVVNLRDARVLVQGDRQADLLRDLLGRHALVRIRRRRRDVDDLQRVQLEIALVARPSNARERALADHLVQCEVTRDGGGDTARVGTLRERTKWTRKEGGARQRREKESVRTSRDRRAERFRVLLARRPDDT